MNWKKEAKAAVEMTPSDDKDSVITVVLDDPNDGFAYIKLDLNSALIVAEAIVEEVSRIAAEGM